MTNYNFCHLTQCSGGKIVFLRSVRCNMETAKAWFSFPFAALTVKGDQNLKRNDSMYLNTPPVFEVPSWCACVWMCAGTRDPCVPLLSNSM